MWQNNTFGWESSSLTLDEWDESSQSFNDWHFLRVGIGFLLFESSSCILAEFFKNYF